MYEVLWQSDDVTNMLPALTLAEHNRHGQVRLRLRVNGSEYVVDDTHNRVALGRADDNDIVVVGSLVSRIHAHIDLQRGRFTLTDQSINGSFVKMDGHQEMFVRRDSVSLTGSGQIGLGRLPDKESPQTIQFACESD
jgi:hypothetical protein